MCYGFVSRLTWVVSDYIYILLQIVFFTQHMYICFICFTCYTIFQSRNTLKLIDPFSYQWAFRLFPFSSFVVSVPIISQPLEKCLTCLFVAPYPCFLGYITRSKTAQWYNMHILSIKRHCHIIFQSGYMD